jgi:hypothetical protein
MCDHADACSSCGGALRRSSRGPVEPSRTRDRPHVVTSGPFPSPSSKTHERPARALLGRRPAVAAVDNTRVASAEITALPGTVRRRAPRQLLAQTGLWKGVTIFAESFRIGCSRAASRKPFLLAEMGRPCSRASEGKPFSGSSCGPAPRSSSFVPKRGSGHRPHTKCSSFGSDGQDSSTFSLCSKCKGPLRPTQLKALLG